MLEKRTGGSRLAVQAASDDGINVPASRGGAAASPTSVLEILWRRRWIVIVCVVLALAASVVYLSKATPIYSSTSQIYLEQSRPKIIGEGVNAAGFASTAQSFLWSQCELLRSSAIISEALGAPEMQEARTIHSSANPVGLIKSGLVVGVSKQGDIISISMESTRPEDAAIVVNAVVGAYVERQNRRHQSTAAEVLKILNNEKKDHEKVLADLSKGMLDFKQKNGVILVDGAKSDVVIQKFAELYNALSHSQIEVMDAKIAMDSAEAFANDPAKFQEFVASLPDPVYAKMLGSLQPGAPGGRARITTADLDAQIQQLNQQIQILTTENGPNHPQVRALTTQVRVLQAEQRRLEEDEVASQQRGIAAVLAVIRENYQKLQRKEQELTAASERQKQEALKVDAKTTEYAQLENAAKREDRLLEILDNRIKEIHIDTESPDAFNSVTILEVAKPGGRVRPLPSQALGIALVIGLMMGVGGALLQDWTDQRIRSAEEIATLLELPVLGTIPHIVGKQTPQERGQEIHLHPRSDVSEAYRTIRTAVYFGVPDANAKTILVTSPSPGDGKSTVASNLALAIAQANRRVLLIDADCRKPVQHRVFQLKQDVGLASVLLGEADVDAAIQKSPTENLDVLPCGPLPANPAELLNGQAFVDLIADLSLKYDQIVIDSPPVVPVTDARILAASTDVTLLVLRAEKSTRKLSEHARDVLSGVGGNVLGVVVNDVPRGRGRYGYYYSGYGYYYSYGYGYGQSPRDRRERASEVADERSAKAVELLTVKTDRDGNGSDA